MTDVLTWTVQQRLELEERAEVWRKELAEVEERLVRLEAAQAVFGEWAEATDGGRRSSGIVDPDPDPDPDPKPVAVTAGAAGMRLVPDRVDGMGVEALTSDHRRIVEIVADAGGPVMAKDVARPLGRELTTAKVEPVRGQLRKLADRSCLARTGAGRCLPRRPSRGSGGGAMSVRNARDPGGCW